MIKLLFVCVENANRSQMAQAFATLYGGPKVDARSAGSRPSGIVNPKAVAAMAELGYDLTTHASKSLDEVRAESFDYVVTMGCGDACPFIAARHRIDWQIPDPRELPPDEFRAVRDLIGAKVKALLAEAARQVGVTRRIDGDSVTPAGTGAGGILPSRSLGEEATHREQHSQKK